MKLLVFQEQLARSLTLASKFLPSRTTVIPSLQSFLLRATKDTITLTASDLEATITITLPGKIEKEGKILLPAKTTMSLLSTFSGEKISLEQEQNNLVMKGEKARVSLKTEAVQDYPQIESQGFEETFKMKRQTIEDVVKRIVFAVSRDQTRAVLTGILIAPQEEGTRFVATDGFRLSLLTKKEEKMSGKDSIVVPARVLTAVVDAWQGQESEAVEVSVADKKNQIRFVLPQVSILARLVSGSFPDYRKIIPTESQTTVTVSRDELLRAVKFASVIAREAANTVRLSINDKEMVVSANAAQTGTNQITLPIQKKGDPVDVAFNYRFLLDLLSAGSEEEVVFETKGALAPGVFRFGKNQNFLHIVMPVRLQESEEAK